MLVTGDARDLVQSLLQRDPEKRPSAVEALQHRLEPSKAALASRWWVPGRIRYLIPRVR